ncbi:MAG: hypothetical protein WDO19_18405 [Bacteroidota bacterium]
MQTLKNSLNDFAANTSDTALTVKNVIVSDDLSVTGWHYIFTHTQ